MRGISRLTGSSDCSLTRVRLYFSRGEGLVKYRRKLNLGLADPALEITPRDARGSKSYWSIVARPPTGQPCRVAACGKRHFNLGRILSALGEDLLWSLSQLLIEWAWTVCIKPVTSSRQGDADQARRLFVGLLLIHGSSS